MSAKIQTRASPQDTKLLTDDHNDNTESGIWCLDTKQHWS